MKTIVAAALAGTLATGAALAQELPKTQLRIVGGLSNLTAYNDYEKPFWTKTIPEKSKGQVTAEIKGFNEMGLKGPELLRLLGQGVIEFGTATLSYFASDNPINEAIDIATIAPDVQAARKVTSAFEPVYAKLYGSGGSNVKLLGVSTYPGQVLFCNAEIKGLGDLKGKKVRTSSRTQAEFVETLGGSSVTMAFGEVVPALQNKVVDCAITGSLSGYSAKWYEVSTHLVALPINWNQARPEGAGIPADGSEGAGGPDLGRRRQADPGRLRLQHRRRRLPACGEGQDDAGAAVGGRPRPAEERAPEPRRQVGGTLLGAVRDRLERHRGQGTGHHREEVSRRT
jgi:TRAP-type C4-dicarboxylate transport system substrate-binding protein